MRESLFDQPDSQQETTVKIYELYPIHKLIQLKTQIQYAIFEPLGIRIDNENTFFTISSTSGWMRFSDHSKLWKSTNGNLLDPHAQTVVKTAEDFLDKANEKITFFNKRHQSDLPAFFPSKTERKLNKCVAVKHRNGNWFDHWLCVFEVYLPGVKNLAATLVYGMTLELRIGAANKVIAFSSRWRSQSKSFDTKLLPLAIKLVKDNHDDQQQAQAKQKNNDIVYVLDGDGNEQYHLTPFYYNADDDTVELFPASSFSLVVLLLQKDTKNDTQLMAVVNGGSGQYTYKWRYWNFDAAMNNTKQIVELGKGQTIKTKTSTSEEEVNIITLPIGHYTIMLDVSDKITSSFKHIQKIIVSRPK